MGNGQPFLYDSVPKESSKYPYSDFDPRAVSRASLAPKPQRTKTEGPLVNFNVHPDSWVQAPYGNLDVKPMSKSTKTSIKWTRAIQLALRVLEMLGAAGSLALFIMLSGIAVSESWIMRIPPGIALLHTVYGIYHLSRNAAGRTPGSSASYMAFAAAADVTLLPFYAFSAYMSAQQYKLFHNGATGSAAAAEWTTLLAQGTVVMPSLTGAAFLTTTITCGLHLISMGLSIYLCLVFRKIMELPPDMNPLEDNLTARPHKRNKSELSTYSTSTLVESEKRISLPLETRRNSGAPYEDLSRPPSIPFLHTRSGSTDSLGSYHSRDSRLDLPSRQYQVSPTNSSQTDLTLKRAPFNVNTPPSSPLKNGTYSEVPLHDRPLSHHKEAWFKSDSLVNADNPYPRIGPPKSHSPSPKKMGNTGYTPLHQHSQSADLAESFPSRHPNPLGQNPSSPPQANQHNRGQSYDPPVSYSATQDFAAKSHSPVRDVLLQYPNAFSQATQKPKAATPSTTPTKAAPNLSAKTGRALTTLSQSTTNVRQASSTYSGDLADASVSDVSSVSSYNRNSEYGSSFNGGKRVSKPNERDLSPVRELTNTKSNTNTHRSFSFSSEVSALSTGNDDNINISKTGSQAPLPQQQQTQQKGVQQKDVSWLRNGVKAKAYGDLRAATPPIMVGATTAASGGGDLGTRQISSGNDWRGRDVSGKVAEEGRGGNTWGTRFRRISGMGNGTFAVKKA